MKMVRTLRKRIEEAGKKAYVISIGRVNVAKLANFGEIEVFVSLACPMVGGGGWVTYYSLFCLPLCTFWNNIFVESEKVLTVW